MDKKNPLSETQLRVLPYAHCDLAALHTRVWHKERYRQIFDKVMELMDTMPEFRWYFDCYRSQLEALFEKYPEKKEQFFKYIKQNRLNFIGAYANIRPNMVGEETYIRNFYIIQKLIPDALSNIYGEEVDVALGHAQIPQILRQFGYEMYKIYRPSDVLDAKGVPSSFCWKGFDGSEIDVVRCDYSAFDKKGTENINTAQDAAEYLYENAKDCIEKSDIPLVWVNCGCDDTLPFTTNQANNDGKVYEVDMKKLIELCESSVRLSSPSEFYEELKQYRDRLQKIEGCLDCADVSYNIAVNGEKGFVPLRLLADELLTRAERWQVIAKREGIDLSFDFESRWKDLLTACSHATQWLFEEDYQRIRGMLLSVIWDAERYLRKLGDEISKRIDAGPNTLRTVFHDGNEAGYRNVTLTIPCADVSKLELEDGRGEKVEFEVAKTHDYNNTWELIINARLYLPAYGYNTVRAKSGDVRALFGKHANPKPQPEKISAEGLHEVNGAGFRLVFLNGNLIQVNDHESDPNNSFNKLTYYKYPYYGSWWEEYSEYNEDAVWESINVFRAGKNALEIELCGKINGMAVTQKISSLFEFPGLHFSVSLDWNPANAWLTASVPCDDCEHVFCDIPFGTQTVNVEEEYADAIYSKATLHRKRKGVITAKRFIASQLGGKDIALLRGNGDRYFQCDLEKKNLGIILLNSIVRTAGTWEEDINNCIEAARAHSIDYTVLFAECTEKNLALNENNLFSSDLAREKPSCTKKLPPFASMFAVAGEDILVTSLRKEKDVVYLRVAETRGKEQKISFPKMGFTDCQAELLSGEPIGKLNLEKGQFVYQLKPFEIVTFALKE